MFENDRKKGNRYVSGAFKQAVITVYEEERIFVKEQINDRPISACIMTIEWWKNRKASLSYPFN